jgi:hypothetical protein
LETYDSFDMRSVDALLALDGEDLDTLLAPISMRVHQGRVEQGALMVSPHL